VHQWESSASFFLAHDSDMWGVGTYLEHLGIKPYIKNHLLVMLNSVLN
jgi:hypothetical protein